MPATSGHEEFLLVELKSSTTVIDLEPPQT